MHAEMHAGHAQLFIWSFRKHLRGGRGGADEKKKRKKKKNHPENLSRPPSRTLILGPLFDMKNMKIMGQPLILHRKS